MPLSDRDYMKQPPPPRHAWRFAGLRGFYLSPIWILIIVNFILFIITTISHDIFNSLGLVPIDFLDKPWTLITSIFVHSDFGHIFFNMLFLYFFGSLLLRLLGNIKFLLIYFVGGILGNVVYLLLALHTPIGEPISRLVGASGAIYALAGTLVVIVPKMMVALWGIIQMPLWVFVIVFLVILSLPVFVSSNVAWHAHLGGIVVGLVAGFFFRRRRRLIYYR